MDRSKYPRRRASGQWRLFLNARSILKKHGIILSHLKRIVRDNVRVLHDIGW